MFPEQVKALVQEQNRSESSDKKRIQRTAQLAGTTERTLYTYLQKGTSAGSANHQLWRMAWKNEVFFNAPLTDEQRQQIEELNPQ